MEYRIGMVVEGVVTGIQNYGIFVSLDNDNQGLIHISELKHSYIKNIHNELKIGQKLKVKVIDIDEYTKKISLSRRALKKRVPYRYAKKTYFTNNKKKIGFISIAKELDNWINQAMDDLDYKQNQDI